MQYVKVEVIKNSKVAAQIFELQVRVELGHVKPGQFVLLYPRGCLLPRPFSVGDYVNNVLTIFYKVVGKGTHELTKLQPTASIYLLGPLGNGFDIPTHHINVIAGGIGIAPFFLLKRFADDVTLVWGVKTKDEFFGLERFKGWDIHLYPEDGSHGMQGIATDCLNIISKDTILACGPIGMLNQLIDFAISNNRYVQVLVEQRIGCGIGACRGCAIRRRAGGYFHLCEDGPVFDARTIVL